MTDRELDLLVADLQYENKQLRHQRDAAVEEAIRLRHTLEHIYAKCVVAIHESRPKDAGSDAQSHADKAAY
jgi:hypothetical protein